MNVNNGKNEKVTLTFLGHDFVIDKIPVAIAAPFNVELGKVRKMTMDAAEKAASDVDTQEELLPRVIEYFELHPEEAHQLNLQTAKAVSCFTEFYTNGEITEEVILREADMDEVNDFMEALQNVVNDSLKKRLEKLSREVTTTSQVIQ